MIADRASLNRWKLPSGAGRAMTTGVSASAPLSALRCSVKARTSPRSFSAGFAFAVPTVNVVRCQSVLLP
jgi:hypothetical protein